VRLDDAARNGQPQPTSTGVLRVFKRGQEIAQVSGFLLVDTKYEFGRAPDGALILIDEVHTPDSSRFWRREEFAQAQRSGGEPEQWDKEYIRLWYAHQGYRGDGEPPQLEDAVIVESARRYIALHEGLTGRTFEPAAYPAQPRIARTLQTFLASA